MIYLHMKLEEFEPGKLRYTAAARTNEGSTQAEINAADHIMGHVMEHVAAAGGTGEFVVKPIDHGPPSRG